jgi:hypothetical protein
VVHSFSIAQLFKLSMQQDKRAPPGLRLDR